jgi:starch synthase
MAKVKTETKRVTTKERKPRAVKTHILKVNTDEQPTPAKKKKTRILFTASEAQPFAGTGGLGEVIASLPKALLGADANLDVRVMLPFYKENISPDLIARFRFICCFNVTLSWRTLYCGVYEYDCGGVRYYFLDNEYYFKRQGLYGFYDDGERFAFFCRAVVESLALIDFIPDVLHAHDWQTALVPVYYKLFYMHVNADYRNIKTVFTIHNIEYQGKYSRDSVEDLFGISRQELHSLEYDGCINLVKAAMDYSDALTTVSPTYAKELMSPEFAHGLSEIVKWNFNKMTGILNGIDYETYDPASDPALFSAYDASDLSGKAKNKAELQKLLDLAPDPDIPLIAIISRLVSHKGMDIIKAIIHDILKQNVQIVLLGKGEADYEGFFQYIARSYERKFKAVIAFNRDLSRKIYAGADIFLMPSRSEPCGLSQMIACRYGTVPVVRETGGLYDSIKDCYDGTQGSGFTFSGYSGEELAGALSRALGLYAGDKTAWNALAAKDMTLDFSWNNSARNYAEFYKNLTE